MFEELKSMEETLKKVPMIEEKQKVLEKNCGDIDREFRAIRDGQYPHAVLGKITEFSKALYDMFNKITNIGHRVDLLEKLFKDNGVSDDAIKAMYNKARINGLTLKMISIELGRDGDDLNFARRIVNCETKDSGLRNQAYDYMKRYIESVGGDQV